ncbi:hypothetical protein [Deinococcus sp. S9]|uniref:hypothetical protein n=1 Tax=Deinococcus sp. S9 TaxID=2545754 RepID=UPI00105666DB|nr:hypothetical protein [Deinococcus sp. S9]TDE84838.1 hypothetical protein E0686_14945 [Deinococcus sp. S9]
MTRGDQKQHADGSFPAEIEGTDMNHAEAKRLDALPGRGARPVPGAEPSEDYVEEHVEGVDKQGPDLLDPTRDERTGNG